MRADENFTNRFRPSTSPEAGHRRRGNPNRITARKSAQREVWGSALPRLTGAVAPGPWEKPMALGNKSAAHTLITVTGYVATTPGRHLSYANGMDCDDNPTTSS